MAPLIIVLRDRISSTTSSSQMLIPRSMHNPRLSTTLTRATHAMPSSREENSPQEITPRLLSSLSGVSEETESGNKLPTGVIVGIAIVFAVVLLVVLILAVPAFRRRRRQGTEHTPSRTPSLHTSTSFVESVTGEKPPFSLSTPLSTPQPLRTNDYFTKPTNKSEGRRPANISRASTSRRAQDLASIQQEMSEIRAEIERLRRVALGPQDALVNGDELSAPHSTYGLHL